MVSSKNKSCWLKISITKCHLEFLMTLDNANNRMLSKKLNIK